jgi:predicted alpha/beta-fold hydrolase
MRLRQFDELYTAPRCGFAGAADYYRRASSLRLISYIGVPTFILTARDDPFICSEPFDELRPPPAVELHVLDHGGHLGFLGPDGAWGIRWAERRLAEWLLDGRMVGAGV